MALVSTSRHSGGQIDEVTSSRDAVGLSSASPQSALVWRGRAVCRIGRMGHMGRMGQMRQATVARKIRNVNKTKAAQFGVVVICAVALKYFYSTANVNQLRWILAPTTTLVELISGQRFYFESYAGYVNDQHTFVIAASCAGVNFLLTAFLMLTLRKLWRDRAQKTNWSFLPVAALARYAATIFTNTMRISLAMQLRQTGAGTSWLSAAQVHRLEGIFVYFGFLLLLYLLSERFGGQRVTKARPQPEVRTTVRRAFFPLLIYYATTLGIPLANGAFKQTDFWEHSLFVILIPLVLVIPLVLLRFARARFPE